MLTKRIIPCLDVKDGRVVKGINFIDLIDAGDPVSQAKLYDKMGADELCFLDITATTEERGVMIDIVKRCADEIFLPLTVGGGIKKLDDFKNLLAAGADKIAINSAAIKTPDFVREASQKYGTQCVVVAIDAKKTSPNRWEIFTHGGRQATGIDALEWAKKMESFGAGEILLTSMDRDGTKQGFDLELTAIISNAVSIPVIASGGAGSLQDIVDGFVLGKADAILAASLFHFGEITVEQAKQACTENGLNMRL